MIRTLRLRNAATWKPRTTQRCARHLPTGRFLAPVIEIHTASQTQHPETFSGEGLQQTPIHADLTSSDNITINPTVAGSDADSEPVVTERERLLRSFVSTIRSNTHSIIESVDSSKQGNELGNGNPKRRHMPLSQRWNAKLRREKNRYNRSNGSRRQSGWKLSLEEQWEQALLSVGIPYTVESDEMASTGEESTAGKAIDQLPLRSPIFDLPMGDDAVMTILDLPIETESDEGNSIESTEEVSTIEHDDDSGLPAGSLSPEQEEELLVDGVHRAIALLSAMSPSEWAAFDGSDMEAALVEDALTTDETPEDNFGDLEASIDELDTPTTTEAIQVLLADAERRKYVLSTSESNTLMALLVTAIDTPIDEILDQSLQLYREMTKLAETGREQCGPDANTYRLLLLALGRRLMALGEAMKISQEMMASEARVPSQAFLEAMQACVAHKDLDTARKLMDTALAEGNVRPPARSYMLMIDMMKHGNLLDEALNLLNRVEEMRLLRNEDEDQMLLALSRWPAKTRRGDSVDATPLIFRIMERLSKKLSSEKRPKMQLWFSVLDRMAHTARTDDSMWPHVNAAVKSLLKANPHLWPGSQLLRIGLAAADKTNDAVLASELIRREIKRHGSVSREPVGQGNLDSDEINELEGSPQLSNTPIPHQVLKKCLEICLRTAAVRNAASVLEAFNGIADAYPTGVQAELNGLALLCQTAGGDDQSAYQILNSMIERDMHPSEEVYGAVLHALVVNNNTEDAKDLFRKMESGEPGFVSPGITSFNAMLVSHVRAHEWEETLSIYEAIRERKIPTKPQTIQGIVLASLNRGGKPKVVSLLNEVLMMPGEIDETTFKLVGRMLVPKLAGTSDEIRASARSIGESHPELRDVSIKLIRSIRIAQVEQGRRSRSSEVKVETDQLLGQLPWGVALSHLLEFQRTSETLSAPAPSS